MVTSPDRKDLGAYYTPGLVVRELVAWATREDPTVHVLDPSCGDGRFLDGLVNAAGIDLDPTAVAAAKCRLPEAHIVHSDFFTWATESSACFDAVVGNPPFIRYQRFTGASRSRAQAYCRLHGVEISGLASSWAPFVVAASTRLRAGGRLAMVVPAEIGQAVYARPVIEFLLEHFSAVEVMAVREKLFPHLSEDCWLLRASGYGDRATHLRFSNTASYAGPYTTWSHRLIARGALAKRGYKLRPFLVAPEVEETYTRLAASPGVVRLGEIATLGIGYVTGANDFFHLRPSEARTWQVPRDLLRPAVRAGRSLVGSDLTQQVVERWEAADDPYLLLDLSNIDEPPPTVQRYLDSEAGLAARSAYKCRNRSPWYRVPDIRIPDAFLTIMSTTGPRIVKNSAGCACTNSLHAVTLREACSADQLLAAWDSPLTQLSCEIEGHPLGGGLLKVEPKEARRILVPLAQPLGHDQVEHLQQGVSTMRAWRHLDA